MPVEGLVVPVEPAARLGHVGEQREQDGAEEGVLGASTGVSARA